MAERGLTFFWPDVGVLLFSNRSAAKTTGKPIFFLDARVCVSLGFSRHARPHRDPPLPL